MHFIIHDNASFTYRSKSYISTLKLSTVNFDSKVSKSKVAKHESCSLCHVPCTNGCHGIEIHLTMNHVFVSQRLETVRNAMLRT